MNSAGRREKGPSERLGGVRAAVLERLALGLLCAGVGFVPVAAFELDGTSQPSSASAGSNPQYLRYALAFFSSLRFVGTLSPSLIAL